MSTDALGYTLGLITVALTMVAVRRNNMLFSIATSAMWAAFLNFIIAQTTDGTTMQEMIIVSILVMIITVPLLSFLSGRRARQLEAKGYYTSESGDITPRQRNIEPEETDEVTEYRSRVRRALHTRRRR